MVLRMSVVLIGFLHMHRLIYVGQKCPWTNLIPFILLNNILRYFESSSLFHPCITVAVSLISSTDGRYKCMSCGKGILTFWRIKMIPSIDRFGWIKFKWLLKVVPCRWLCNYNQMKRWIKRFSAALVVHVVLTNNKMGKEIAAQSWNRSTNSWKVKMHFIWWQAMWNCACLPLQLVVCRWLIMMQRYTLNR